MKTNNSAPLKFLLLALFILLQNHLVFAQNKEPGLVRKYVNSLIFDTNDVAESRLLIYPTLAYSPETRWEFGFSTLFVYYANKDTNNRLSEVSGFTFYTQEKQWGIWFDHALYSNKDKWFLLGRTRFQDFPLLYYGVGRNAPSKHVATLDGKYVLIKERLLRKVAPSVFMGLELDFQNLYDVDFVQADLEEPVASPKGADGSGNLGFGLGLLYDNRHNVLNVRHGFFSELAFLRYDDAWASDYSFTTLISDTRIFRPLNKRNVIAGQLYGQFTFGDVPVNQLALMGGESLMRGYYLGRYRDDYLTAAQIEYRMLPFSFSKRWGATAFLGLGQVFSDENKWQMNKLLPAGGVGLRFLLFPSKDIFARLDFAFTAEGPGYYIYIGEAF